MTRRVLAVAVLLVWCVPTALQAWGREGHTAIARVAWERLSDDARERITILLGGADVTDVVMWPDGSRNSTHRASYNWHFVNIPITSDGYRRNRDCRPRSRGDCIIAALVRLERNELTNVDMTITPRERLMFLLHFVGDLHQPLHAGHNGDLGGTQRDIEPIGDRDSLHSAWDSGIIRASRVSIDNLVARANAWLETQDEAAIADGLYRNWAMEGFAIARDVAYPQVENDNKITDSERRTALRLIEQRVAEGGVRLAAVLNRVYGA
jgi:hypothetical protein